MKALFKKTEMNLLNYIVSRCRPLVVTARASTSAAKTCREALAPAVYFARSGEPGTRGALVARYPCNFCKKKVNRMVKFDLVSH